MKAILVVDMPKSCEDCDCSFEDTDYGLFCSPLKRDIFGRDEKPSWCPLKPMPKKKMPKHGEMFPQDMRLVDRWKGYDMCIDEISGEAE